MIKTIGAFHDNTGRVIGASAGAKRLKSYFDAKKGVDTGEEINEFSNDKITSTENFCIKLRDKVADSIQKNNLTLVFGGDHSVAMGSISGAILDNRYNTGIIYIDAHADMNTFRTSLTGNIHGMPLAVCLGKESRFKRIVKKHLTSNNLLLLGQRSIDPGEEKLIRDENIQCIRSNDIRLKTPTEINEFICDFINRNKLNRIHISFDIDVIDPNLAPGTGVPEYDGLSTKKTMEILDLILESGLVKSIDIVEYNPHLDINDNTFNILNQIVDLIYSKYYNYKPI